FFGQSERQFADARPFDILSLHRHDGGEVVVGVAQPDIVPAGTPARLQENAVPVDGLAAAFDGRGDQPLAPTAHTWLVVQRTDVADAPLLVLVLPKDVASEEAFEAAVHKRLASPQWMASWLGQSDPTHLAAVFEKKVMPG